ncbi:MAG: leucyl aminopeptidase [Salibacter sp.]|uniref:leucyl aminopeptidase family protein n=1 Tax=Salibacter sp. TaxID=2010995 RepID=UPI0028703AA7|nr:leucyl aminopeptidase [Salibacter sp.]MDR9397658.1 leucyl aminopeptidase [Salibacter sp.]
MIEIKNEAIDGGLILIGHRNVEIHHANDEAASYFKRRMDADEKGIANVPHGDEFTSFSWYSKEGSQSALLEKARKAGAKLHQAVNGDKISKITVRALGDITKEEVLAFVEGIILQSYSFEKYKKNKVESSLKEIGVVVDNIDQQLLDEVRNTAQAVFLARDLVNEPVITLNAQEFSQRIIKAGKDSGFVAEVLTEAVIKELNMGGLLGVNRGSIDPPTFNIMEWKPENAKNEQPIVLVGKGVVYDTGGNNLKGGKNMSSMKSDMGGGAAVTGAMYAIAKNKLPVHVIGLVPATDNRIDKNALVPDDVITISDGTTIEIQNTDAEGRLILSDALVYAKKYDPQLVVDFATLTGAAAAITGPFGVAMVGTADDDTKKSLNKSGEQVYERIAELPFWEEYGDLLKSDIADMKNVGGPIGGAVTAGKFLHHFTDYPWIHLDIAGPAFLDAADDYKPVGGTGVGVRLMYDFVKSLA